MDQVTEVGGVKLLAASVPGVDMNGLRELGDYRQRRSLVRAWLCWLLRQTAK